LKQNHASQGDKHALPESDATEQLGDDREGQNQKAYRLENSSEGSHEIRSFE